MLSPYLNFNPLADSSILDAELVMHSNPSSVKALHEYPSDNRYKITKNISHTSFPCFKREKNGQGWDSPTSTITPFWRTTIWSAFFTVLSRCAMTRTVRPFAATSSAFCTLFSDCASKALEGTHFGEG